jgi:hypothetical protein
MKVAVAAKRRTTGITTNLYQRSSQSIIANTMTTTMTWNKAPVHRMRKESRDKYALSDKAIQ